MSDGTTSAIRTDGLMVVQVEQALSHESHIVDTYILDCGVIETNIALLGPSVSG
jgi:hypothetical protein